MRAAVLGGIKNVLKFYEALGFADIPLSIPNPGAGKQIALDALRAEIGDCRICRLHKGRTHLVFGEGNPDADIIFVGEGPGREEDESGRPFVGEAGMILTRMILRMGFRREDVYIGNIVKCRPPGNRNPSDDEAAACLPFIERQIEIVSPRVIIALGSVAAKALTGLDTPIGKLRGRFLKFGDINLMPTYHPAYLLRNPSAKEFVWQDAQKVLKTLGRKPAGKDVLKREIKI